MQTADQTPPYDVIVFDCDSTLSCIEGIDELASKQAPAVRTEIEALTARAMSGELTLEEVYATRLEMIKPRREELAALGQLYVARAVPNAVRVTAQLAARGKELHVMSGGLRPAVLAMAQACGIPDQRVHAVEIEFDERGEYAGFDQQSPLVRQPGKLELLRELGLDRRRTALVGDGSTDLIAQPACARFIAFAGVERRAAVVEAAFHTVVEFDFAALLPLLLTPSELALVGE